jgi:cell division protein FtsI (penicillin-binding protein 3)
VGAIGDTYEPGSTAKIFTAAALLRTGKATPHDTVDAEQGTWRTGRRTITDTHKAGLLTLTDVIRLSSNIGIAKLGARLTPEEQYETLRDFGFGTPTGIELAGEAAGRLRPPRAWTDVSAASLAMGYELSVTPVQLAAAYATFANGGVLVEPSLVREVRGPDGAVRWRHAPRPVRRVVSAAVAAQLMHVLRNVVEEGTGSRASLGAFGMAGKTGTARRNIGGRYVEGRYTASFVGLFPAVDPQMVLVVKIDDPEGDYFGGERAAPLTRAIVEAALATPAVTLDRSRLRHRRAPVAAVPEGADAPDVVATVPWPPAPVADEPAAERPVPDVAGQSLRAAARTLHRAGFRVRVDGWGPARETSPAAGVSAPAGSVVVVHGGGNRAS